MSFVMRERAQKLFQILLKRFIERLTSRLPHFQTLSPNIKANGHLVKNNNIIKKNLVGKAIYYVTIIDAES